ncbi:MAG: hypothetical protein SGILL_000778 [Bacillariaceae sp.]
MVDSSGEDTSKKRDNAQVHYDHEEKPKKIPKNGNKGELKDDENFAPKPDSDDDSNAAILPSPPKRRATERSTSTTSSTNGSPGEKVASASPRKQQKTEQKFAAAQIAAVTAKRQAAASAAATKRESNANCAPKREVWDLESAMLYLVRLNKLPDANNHEDSLESAMKKAALSSPSSTTQTKPSATSPHPRPQDREYLTAARDSWITFVMAHCGDAATIANWYHTLQQEEASKQQQDEEEKPEIAVHRTDQDSSNDTTTPENVDQETRATTSPLPEAAAQQLPMLEHWLAEGLGDEVTCPSVYGLLAYVHTDNGGASGKEKTDERDNGDKKAHKKEEQDGGDEEPKGANAEVIDNEKVSKETSPTSLQQPCMAAVVLLTLAWTSNERHLRVEWMAIDIKNLATPIAQAVQQKVWLRISALSVMTACPVIAVDETLLIKASGTDTNEDGAKEETLSKKKSIPPSAE